MTGDNMPSLAGPLAPDPLIERVIELVTALTVAHPPHAVEITQADDYTTVTFTFQAAT